MGPGVGGIRAGKQRGATAPLLALPRVATSSDESRRVGVTLFSAEDVLKNAVRTPVGDAGGDKESEYMFGVVTVRPAQGCVTSERKMSLAPAGVYRVLSEEFAGIEPAWTQSAFSVSSAVTYELVPQPVSGCAEAVCDASELRHQHGASVNPSCRFLLRQDMPLKASWDSYRHSASVGVIEVMEHYLHRMSWYQARRAGMLRFNSSLKLHGGFAALHNQLRLEVSIERPKLISEIERGEGDNVFGLLDFGLVDLNEKKRRMVRVFNPTSFPIVAKLAVQEFVDAAYEGLCESMKEPGKQHSAQNESACQLGQWGPRPLDVGAHETFSKTSYSLGDAASTGSASVGPAAANEQVFSSATGSEVIIPPGETAELGPIEFVPAVTGRLYSVVYIRNNLTGLETVVLRGEGADTNVMLVPSDAWDHGKVALYPGKIGRLEHSEIQAVLNASSSFFDHYGTSAVSLPTLDGGARGARSNHTFALLNVGRTPVSVDGMGFGKAMKCSVSSNYGSFMLGGTQDGGTCDSLQEQFPLTLEPGGWWSLEISFSSTCISALHLQSMSISVTNHFGNRVDDLTVYGHVSFQALAQCLGEQMVAAYGSGTLSGGRMLLSVVLVVVIAMMGKRL